MEVNNDVDVDSLLVRQFSSMATQDHEVLVAELQRLLGDQLSAEGCAFFLDMNDWNLQAAVCSYFEFQQDVPTVTLPKMSLIVDEVSKEMQAVPPNTVFRKTWRMINSGNQSWPPGCCLRFIAGAQMTANDRVMVDALQPSCAAEITLELTSPSDRGTYKGEWRMSTITGTFFGDLLSIIINVEHRSFEVLDGLSSELGQASIGPHPDSSEMDDADVTQGSNARFLPAGSAMGSNVIAAGFPPMNPVLFQSPDSLQSLATLQTNVRTCESDFDTMETS